MKKVALINDISGFGRCSLTAALPVISVLGVSCNPVATAVLTGQSGYEHYYCKDMTDMLLQYIDAWKKNKVSFDGIYSGYLTGPKQIDYINAFLDEFLREDTFLLVDPVMGDNGKGYSIFSEELLEKMKSLIKRADLITPNLTESCMISGVNYHELSEKKTKEELFSDVEKIAETIRASANDKLEIVITGIRYREKDVDYICNLALTNEGVSTTCSTCAGKSFSGTGDLFASAICGLKMNGVSTGKAVELATRFVDESIMATLEDNIPGTDGINFEEKLHILLESLN